MNPEKGGCMHPHIMPSPRPPADIELENHPGFTVDARCTRREKRFPTDPEDHTNLQKTKDS